MPRRDTRLTVKEKLAIVVEAERGTVKGAARAHGIQPSQVRHWRKYQERLELTVKRNPSARSVNASRPREDPDLETSLAAWIRERRALDIAVTTEHVICKALSLNPTFHGGNVKTHRHWVYPFLDRNHLSIRRRTHVGQKLSGHLQQVCDEFVEMINERFKRRGTMEGTPSSLIVNMDETAVYFEMAAKTTINATGSNTIAVRASGSSSQRATACIACALDGTKLPLFFVFKGKPGAIIESRLPALLPPGVFGCCQENRWMDDRGCRLWAEQVWAPYVEGRGASMLIVDELKNHLGASFRDKLSDMGTDLEIIPGGYTSVIQPCDVGVNKPVKDAIRKEYSAWAAARIAGLAPAANVPVPRREDIVRWVVNAWELTTPESIRRTWKSIGFGIDLNVAAACESESAESEEIIDTLLDELNL